MNDKEIIEKNDKYSARNYGPLPVVLSKGKGNYVWDVNGKKYLDLLSSYSALNQGHLNEKIINALIEQAGKLTLTSRAFHNDKMPYFLEKLCNLAGFEKALPMNTGAEGVETAIKTARKWGYKVKGVEEGKAEIAVCENNFHGRTTTIVGFSTEEQYKDGFGPFTPGFKAVPYNDLDALKNAINENTVAFLLEPIQGEGGIIIPDQGYLSKARDICRENNVLFILDEIQTGLGRTGKMFAFQHEDAKPDLLILGKALGGGVYPVSAVLGNQDVLGVFNPGDHGSTFGGNPLGSAVAIASLDVLVEKKLDERAMELGDWFVARLKEELKSDKIKEIRGKGLLIGIEIKEEAGKAKPYCLKLMDKGILCYVTHEQVIRIAPPLTITKEELEFVLKEFKEVLE